MLGDALLGFVAAVVLLVLFSLLLTGLTDAYRKFLGQWLMRRFQRSELIDSYARFAAVVTILLFVGLLLIWRFAA